MKTIKQLGFAVTMALTLALSSCSSSDGGGGGGAAGLGTLKANVGGTNFTSIAQGTTALIADNGTYQNLSIGGADATGKVMQLMILAPEVTAGTYQLSEDAELPSTASFTQVNLSTSQAEVWGAPYTDGGNSGSIVITSITATNVQGTFSFVGRGESGPTKSITNGSFNVNITSN